MTVKNTALIALTTSCLLQIGAQMFALSVVASTIIQAPPRSFAILNGEYGYNSSAFWNIMPMVTLVLFIVALVLNWRNQRRKYIFTALLLFIGSGLIAGIFLEPVFADLIKGGYSDHIDPILQKQAKNWYFLDWTVWALGLLASLILLISMTLVPTNREAE